MKRTSFLIIVFLLISILAGCAEANAFDWDKTVEAVTGQAKMPLFCGRDAEGGLAIPSSAPRRGWCA